MPKIKTHKGTQHRLKVTGTGKVMRGKIGSSHLRRKKPGRVKRQYDGMLVLDSTHERRISGLLPYA